jgi:hemoglobin/transferrin/lactoferrin receptor protein
MRYFKSKMYIKMKKYIFWSLFISMPFFIGAQSILIIDQESRVPVEMATLISESTDEFAITNAQGKADISAFSGSVQIEIRSLSYETRVLSFEEIAALNFEVALKASSILLDDVVVSATRWNQVSRNVPSKIVSISPSEVSLQNPQTAADLLNVSGKVYIQKSQQGGGSPHDPWLCHQPALVFRGWG